jgi:hypothetical protein
LLPPDPKDPKARLAALFDAVTEDGAQALSAARQLSTLLGDQGRIRLSDAGAVGLGDVLPASPL